jgi:hypothetical protein
MKARGRTLPLRAGRIASRSEASCRTSSTLIPLSSGAQRQEVQLQVEGSEGGMTSGAFSQNTHYTALDEAARGRRCPICAASVWEKDIPGMTLRGAQAQGN